MYFCRFLALSALTFLLGYGPISQTVAENYPQFRGAEQNGNSIKPLPVEWQDIDGQSSGVRWKVKTVGEGWSQPIVWGSQVIYTEAVPVDQSQAKATRPERYNGGYGRDRDDLVNVSYEYRVNCLDRGTGRMIWSRVVKTGKPPLPRHTTNTYATETPATDGERIYAYFGMNGLYCLSMDGDVLWQKDLGVFPMRAGWGTSSSVALHQESLFLQIDNEEQSFAVCLEAKTGAEKWKINRDEKSQYSSPFIWQNSIRTELILGGMVYRAYDIDSGELLWSMDMDKGRSSATPIAVGDQLFIGNEFRNRGGSDDGGGRLYCISPGGQGDLSLADEMMSGPNVRWRMDDSGIQMASPVHCQGYLYFFQRRAGIVTCVRASNGEKVFESRVRGAKSFWSSPWSDGHRVYALDASGNTHIFTPGDELETLAVNPLDQMSWASPALSDGNLFLRTIDHLYCIDGQPH